MSKKRKYKVRASVTISLHATIEASSEKEAMRIAEGLAMPDIATSGSNWITGDSDEDFEQPEYWPHSGELDGEALDITVEP